MLSYKYREKVAENLKKQGSYIPGVRPGVDTEEYLSKVLSRITFIGAIYLVVIAGSTNCIWRNH